MVKIETVNTADSFLNDYYEYGMHTIEDRALADVRDGLKPVHRRIVYDMLDSKLTSKSRPAKVSKIVGQVMGKYHPHGDAAIAGALVGLSTWWKNPLPIIKVKGNNGSIYGDPAAHGRYIEANLTPAGEKYGEFLKEGIVPFVPNYDETEKMPTVLPAQLPYLLINGSLGIAVSISGSIPTHNPHEAVSAFIAYAKKPKIKTYELLEIMPGPDFPSKGRIINQDDLLEIYEKGVGTLRLQGRVRYDRKQHSLHIYELPYTFSGSMDKLVDELTKGSMERVIKKAGKKVKQLAKFPMITEVADNSGRDGIDIKLSLAKGANPDAVIQMLFAKTRLESTYRFEFLALNNNKVKQYSLKSYFKEYLEFQHEIVKNEHSLKLAGLQKRMNIVHGLLILQNVVDEVIASAKASASKAELIEVLTTGKILDVPKKYHKTIKTFRFNQEQAEHIAGIAIYKLSRFDQQELVKEGQSLQKEIAQVEAIVTDEKKRHKLIIKRHEQMLPQLPSERQTEIVQESVTKAPTIEQEVVDVFVATDKYQYVRIENKEFDGATKLTTKDRIGFFDSEGILWNVHLENQKPTKDRGSLATTLVDAKDIVGVTTTVSQDDEHLGLFVFASGHVRVSDMRKYMTKQKATKVASGKTKEQLIAYYDIPETTKCVAINGQEFKIDELSLQGVSGLGRKTIKPTELVDVEFK